MRYSIVLLYLHDITLSGFYTLTLVGLNNICLGFDFYILELLLLYFNLIQIPWKTHFFLELIVLYFEFIVPIFVLLLQLFYFFELPYDVLCQILRECCLDSYFAHLYSLLLELNLFSQM